jgi:hypothetical protein
MGFLMTYGSPVGLGAAKWLAQMNLRLRAQKTAAQNKQLSRLTSQTQFLRTRDDLIHPKFLYRLAHISHHAGHTEPAAGLSALGGSDTCDPGIAQPAGTRRGNTEIISNSGVLNQLARG